MQGTFVAKIIIENETHSSMIRSSSRWGVCGFFFHNIAILVDKSERDPILRAASDIMASIRPTNVIGFVGVLCVDSK